MPIHSGVSRGLQRQSSARKHPTPPPLIQPQSPEEALAASISAVSGLLHHIQQILAGPMRRAPNFLKQYLKNSAKTAADLLKQLANRLDGIPVLDGVATAGVDLLALAAEHDPDAAAELAAALEGYVARNGAAVDAATEKILAQASTLEVQSTAADVRFENGDLWVNVRSTGKLVTAAGVVDVEIQGIMPVSHLQLTMRPGTRT